MIESGHRSPPGLAVIGRFNGVVAEVSHKRVGQTGLCSGLTDERKVLPSNWGSCLAWGGRMAM